MSDRMQDVQDKLRLLQQHYLSHLPRDIARIHNIWANLRPGHDEPSLQALYRMVHHLNGSGATFGFPAISDIAGRVEQMLLSVIEQPHPPAFEQCTRIDHGLKALHAKVHALVHEEPSHGPADESLFDNEKEGAQASRCIVLVEEDAALADDLKGQLTYFGYNVQVLAQLAGLKKALRDVEAAALIVDMVFSGECWPGFDTLIAVQKTQKAPLPVLFLSIRGDLRTRLQAVRAGGKAYFVKPVDISGLIDTLDKITAWHPPDPYRILIIEDNPDLAAYYAGILEQAGMTAMVITDPMETTGVMAEFRPDLLLTDLYMPECNGLELATVIRQQPEYVGIPLVFLSTETSLRHHLAALYMGGDDFLTKPIQANHLVASISARAQRARTLRSFMARDSLTGLLNHTATAEQLRIEIARSERQKAPLSMAMIDIDRFKSVNDTYGHPTGDRVLKNLARLLQQRLRQTDIVGRYGGEEFVVVLSGTDVVHAACVMDEIRERFSQIRQQSDEAEFSVTLSCGIASTAVYKEAVALSEASDKALYAAKHAGRNRVMLAEGEA